MSCICPETGPKIEQYQALILLKFYRYTGSYLASFLGLNIGPKTSLNFDIDSGFKKSAISKTWAPYLYHL
jgi:hypothetical protein